MKIPFFRQRKRSTEKEVFEAALAAAIGDFVRRSVDLYFWSRTPGLGICINTASSVLTDMKASGYDAERFLAEPIRQLIRATDGTFESKVYSRKALLDLAKMSEARETVQ